MSSAIELCIAIICIEKFDSRGIVKQYDSWRPKWYNRHGDDVEIAKVMLLNRQDDRLRQQPAAQTQK